MGDTEGYLSAFSTLALRFGATRTIVQSNGDAGMKRNPLGMANMSAGFHKAVIVVHVT